MSDGLAPTTNGNNSRKLPTGEQYLLIPAAVLQAGTYNLTLQTPTAQIGPSHFTMTIQTPPQSLLLAPAQHRVFQDLTALCCVYQGTAFSVTTPGSLCQRYVGLKASV